MAGARQEQGKIKDEADDIGQGMLNVAPGTAVTGQAAKPTGAAATAPVSTPKQGTGFVNLQSYLTGNPGAAQRMATKAKDAVQGDITGFETESKNAGAGFATDVGKDVTTVSPEVLSGLKSGKVQTIDPTQTTYEGPTSILAQPTWEGVNKSEAKAKASTGLVTGDNLSGAGSLITRGEKPYQTTAKMRGLTGAMLATERPAFSGLSDILKGTQENVGKIVTSSNELVESKQKEAAKTKQDIIDAAGTGVGALSTQLGGELSTRETPQRIDLRNQIQTNFHNETGQWMSNEEADKLVTMNNDPLAGLSSDQLVQINALRAMAGQPPITTAGISGGINMGGLGMSVNTAKDNKVKADKDYAARVAAMELRKGTEAAMTTAKATEAAEVKNKQAVRDAAAKNVTLANQGNFNTIANEAAKRNDRDLLRNPSESIEQYINRVNNLLIDREVARMQKKTPSSSGINYGAPTADAGTITSGLNTF